MSVSVAFAVQKTTAVILSLCFSKNRLTVPVLICTWMRKRFKDLSSMKREIEISYKSINVPLELTYGNMGSRFPWITFRFCVDTAECNTDKTIIHAKKLTFWRGPKSQSKVIAPTRYLKIFPSSRYRTEHAGTCRSSNKGTRTSFTWLNRSHRLLLKQIRTNDDLESDLESSCSIRSSRHER